MVSPQIKRKMRKIHFKVNKNAPGIKSSFPVNDDTDGSGNRTTMQHGESQLGGQLELNNNNNHTVLCAKSIMMDTLGKADESDGDDGIKFENNNMKITRTFVSNENLTDGNTILCAKTMMIDALGRVDILNNNDDNVGEDIKATGKKNKIKISENMKHRTTSDETSRDDKTILCAKTMMIEALARINISDNDKTSFYKTNTDHMVLLDPRISLPDEILRGDKARHESGVKIVRGTFERKSSVGKTIIIRATTKLTNSSSKENKKNMSSTSNNNLKCTYETVGNSIQDTGSVTTLASLKDKEDITSRIAPRFSRDNTTSVPDDYKVTREENTKDTFGRKISDLGKNMNNNCLLYTSPSPRDRG